ncbi:phage tail sheath protein FI [Bradyrhizobium diazoefficiens]
MVAVNTDTLVNLPGVKIREVQLVGPPIAGVGTSTPGFVGEAPAKSDTPGDTLGGRFAGVARLVTSADQFIRDYINKVANGTGTSYTTTATGFAAGTTTIPLITGSGTVLAGDHVTFAGDNTEYEVKTGVAAPGSNIELKAPGLVKAIPASATAMTIVPFDPNKPAATVSTPLSHAVFGYFQNGGGPCYVVNIVENKNDNLKNGIAALERIDVQIIAAPGYADTTTYQWLIDQATALKDRFAILDAPPKANDRGDLIKKNSSIRPKDSPWAAFYYPQIQVSPVLKDDPTTKPIWVPPTGHIAGMYGRVDALRGVHKAPANEVILGALGVEDVLNDSDQDALNNDGVNAIRLFAQGSTVFGARTVQAHDADKTFLYISTRRLLTYVEQSLKVGLRFAVFEPNNLALRQKIIRSARGFLDGVWRDGALFGATADEAYYVRFPDTFNSDADRALGKLTLEVGLRVTYPAEFIIVRIGLLLQNASTA